MVENASEKLLMENTDSVFQLQIHVNTHFTSYCRSDENKVKVARINETVCVRFRSNIVCVIFFFIFFRFYFLSFSSLPSMETFLTKWA